MGVVSRKWVWLECIGVVSIGVNRPDLGGTVLLLGYSSRCPALH